MELEQAIELFLGEHKASTREAYSQGLRPMMAWMGPKKDLTEVRPELLIEYFQMVVKKRGYAPATEQKHIKSVKVFFNWCIKLDLLITSPAKMVKGKRLSGAVDRHKAMTDEELVTLLDTLRFKPRDYALVMFLADTGCRRGGAVGLRMKDIDWNALVAVVTEKGEKTRKVAFGEKCAAALSSWLWYRSEHYTLKGEYIFTRDGLPMHASNISLMMRRACKVAGLRSLSSHSLRHRKGHQLADARVAPSIAATALGHDDPQITLKYYYPKDWESAEKALRGLMTNPEAAPVKSPKIIQFGS